MRLKAPDSGVARRVTTLEQRQSEPWIALTLLNGWVPFSVAWATPAYFKDVGGEVEVKAMIKNGTTAGGTSIAVLPVGYRPAESLVFNVATSSGHCNVNVQSDGTISFSSTGDASWTSLCGIRFRAA